ncbi:hypothetical protein DM01DRAFT_256472 [Hesseltinella vesiculosa]|uniref:Beta-hexosaminidase n=1 Tax=Hesseltinella vesiculosa TaxID=101127 RepID=A0A1X2GTN4_9FUNG|nr:hypothetical protein DM01DRAFT_256472 [Hesseltinella vesiculosa]
MKLRLTVSVLLGGLYTTFVQAKDGNYLGYLWPVPQSVNYGKWDLPIDLSFHMIGPNNDILNNAMQRYSMLLTKEHWQQVQVPFRQTPSKAQVHAKLISLTIEVDQLKAPLAMDVDESYTLTIPLHSHAQLKAHTVWGALRGLETFVQLVQHDVNQDERDDDGEVDVDREIGLHNLVIANAPITIHDKPAYSHRGLMLDTARNYFPVFHWHLADSQSFPLELDDAPELAGSAAYVFQGKRLVYRKRDVQQILAYGYERGIRVIPEIDMPGHTASWALSHEDIVTCAGLYYLDPTNAWANRLAAEPGSGQLNPIKKKTYDIVGKVIKNVAELFPDAYIHGGADEPVYNCWDKDASVTDYMKQHNKTHDDLLAMFLARELTMIHSHGKKSMLWEDAVTLNNLPIPKDVLLQVWTNPLQVAVKKGYDVIASNSNFWYLDCGHGGWSGNDTSYSDQLPPTIPDDLQKMLEKYDATGNYNSQNFGGPGGDWCSPFKSWQRVYSYNLNYNLTKDERARVKGGEVALWAEQTDHTSLDGRLWPRTAAAAEVLWSGNEDENGHMRDIGVAMPRMFDWRYRLVARGINAEAVQPLWCGQNPHMCDAAYPAVFL